MRDKKYKDREIKRKRENKNVIKKGGEKSKLFLITLGSCHEFVMNE